MLKLLQDERIDYRRRLHPSMLLPDILWFVIALFFLLISMGYAKHPILFVMIVAVLILSVIIHYELCYCLLTNRRVVFKTRLLPLQGEVFYKEDIYNIMVKQQFLGNLLNFGTLMLLDNQGNQHRFGFIANPLRVKAMIQSE